MKKSFMKYASLALVLAMLIALVPQSATVKAAEEADSSVYSFYLEEVNSKFEDYMLGDIGDWSEYVLSIIDGEGEYTALKKSEYKLTSTNEKAYKITEGETGYVINLVGYGEAEIYIEYKGDKQYYETLNYEKPSFRNADWKAIKSVKAPIGVILYLPVNNITAEKYTLSDKKIVDVDIEYGSAYVTTKAAGKTVLTVEQGDKKASITITVTNKQFGLEVEQLGGGWMESADKKSMAQYAKLKFTSKGDSNIVIQKNMMAFIDVFQGKKVTLDKKGASKTVKARCCYMSKEDMYDSFDPYYKKFKKSKGEEDSFSDAVSLFFANTKIDGTAYFIGFELDYTTGKYNITSMAPGKSSTIDQMLGWFN